MSAAAIAFDSDYIDSLRRGVPAVETHFVEHFTPLLLRSLRRKVRSMDQVRELCQETFLRVLSAVRCECQIRQPERFPMFVMGICNNVVREMYREQRRSVSLDALEIEPAGDFPSAYTLMLANETRGRVQGVLARLDHSEQNILKAVLLEEQNKDEICRRFGVSRGYLRVLLFRAKKRFRSRVEKPLPPTRRTRSTSLTPERVSCPGLEDAAMLFAKTAPFAMFGPALRLADSATLRPGQHMA